MSARRYGGLVALALALLGAAVWSAVAGGAPLAPVVKELVVGVLFVFGGLTGWAWRPDSATGRLMTAAGLVWLLARVLVWSDLNSFVFTVGLVLVLAPIAFVAHLAVAFPGGRIPTRFERGVVVSAYVVILGGVAFVNVDVCGECPSTCSRSAAVTGPAGWPKQRSNLPR